MENTLRATLTEIRKELTEKLKTTSASVAEQRKAVLNVSAMFDGAQEEYESAVGADEQMKKKQRELIDYYNRLSEKPSALMDKIESLRREQGKTYRRRESAKEILKTVNSRLTEERERLEIIEAQMLAMQGELEGVSRQIFPQ